MLPENERKLKQEAERPRNLAPEIKKKVIFCCCVNVLFFVVCCCVNVRASARLRLELDFVFHLLFRPPQNRPPPPFLLP